MKNTDQLKEELKILENLPDTMSNKMKKRKLQKEIDMFESKSKSEASGVLVSAENKDENKIQYIEINKIKLPNFKDRTGIEQDKIEELAQSIQNQGLIQPVILYKDDDGYYVKIVGRRRILATKHLKKDKVKAIVIDKPKSEEELNLLILHENVKRVDLSHYDKVRAILNIIENRLGCSKEEAIKHINKVNNINKNNIKNDNDEYKEIVKAITEILELTNVYKTTANLVKHLKVLQLDDILLKALEKNEVSFDMAVEMQKYNKVKFQNVTFEELVLEAIKNNFSKNEFLNFIESLIEHKEEKKSNFKLNKTLKQLKGLGSKLPQKDLNKFQKELDALIQSYSLKQL